VNSRSLRTARPVARLQTGRADWYRIENSANGTATIYIYDEIGYWGVTADMFCRELVSLDVETIELRINSPGGDVFDAVAIYNALCMHPANVVATVDGLAASAASFIFQAGNERNILRNAQAMIHDAWGMCIGPAEDMRAMADLLDKTSANVADIYAQRAGGTVDEWRSAMLAETWYNADEMVEAGLADAVVDPNAKASASAPAGPWDLSIFTYPNREAAPANQWRMPEPAAPPKAAVPEQPAPVVSVIPEWFDLDQFRNGLKGATQ
jgi:ATP-dependent protease ClpP protease subunit